MCIRDRCVCVCLSVDVFSLLYLPWLCIFKLLVYYYCISYYVVIIVLLYWVRSVSYTHLDVYKRQQNNRSRLPYNGDIKRKWKREILINWTHSWTVELIFCVWILSCKSISICSFNQMYHVRLRIYSKPSISVLVAK